MQRRGGEVGQRKQVGRDFVQSSGAVLVGSNGARGSGTPAGVRVVLAGLPGVVAKLDPRLTFWQPSGLAKR